MEWFHAGLASPGEWSLPRASVAWLRRDRLRELAADAPVTWRDAGVTGAARIPGSLPRPEFGAGDPAPRKVRTAEGSGAAGVVP